MFSRAGLAVAVGLVVMLLSALSACAEEPPPKRAEPAVASAGSFLGRIAEMSQAAADLRKAAEAFERFATVLDRLTETIAKSLATMSSEFDPFGYKTAFRTVGQQADMLQQQRDIIQSLHLREIDRLRRENRRLKRELQKLRESERAQDGSAP